MVSDRNVSKMGRFSCAVCKGDGFVLVKGMPDIRGDDRVYKIECPECLGLAEIVTSPTGEFKRWKGDTEYF